MGERQPASTPEKNNLAILGPGWSVGTEPEPGRLQICWWAGLVGRTEREPKKLRAITLLDLG